MSENNKNITVEDVFTWNPSEVQMWFDSVRSGRESVPETFNWLLLAEHAGSLAHRLDDLEWAKVGILVYEWLHKSNLDYFDLSSMFLRASFISKRGSVAGDPYLDLNLILKWFYETLPMSFSEAEVGIPKCKETIAKANIKVPDDLQLCRELRTIKNHLNVLSFLVESGALVPDDDLSKWLDLKAKLP